jgi:outer membrane lipoprotein-sorting protein
MRSRTMLKENTMNEMWKVVVKGVLIWIVALTLMSVCGWSGPSLSTMYDYGPEMQQAAAREQVAKDLSRVLGYKATEAQVDQFLDTHEQ